MVRWLMMRFSDANQLGVHQAGWSGRLPPLHPHVFHSKQPMCLRLAPTNAW